VRYLLAVIGGSIVFIAVLPLGYRSGFFDMDLLKYSLVVISSAVVVAVSRPWKGSNRHDNSLFWSGVAWLATVGCVIFVFAINFIFLFWYACSRENCMP
jgi:NADH:ubiquinone oxidoreductase subunit 2 (subunit N)